MTHVLIVASDKLPLPGLPTSGGGLRAWGLAQGLIAHGHDVRLAMPAYVARKFNYTGGDVILYEQGEVDAAIRQAASEVVILQSSLINIDNAPLKKPDAFTVVDFHGPMLMEMSYSGKDDLAPFMLEKLKLIAQADFFTCAGEIQRKYFEPWLLLAGHDARDLPIQTVPLSLSPHLPAHHAPEEEPVFIYGGSPLPWQDPALGLHILVEELERAARGKLRLFGGAPGNEAPERFIKLWSEMDESTCVDRSGLLARSEVLEMLTHASIAWDVMARNPERELAFTTRTVEYLWCGLPVVYNDYAELASYIAEYEAGWTVDPGDADAMRAIIRRILSDPDEVRRRGENARRLVRERLTWDRTIAPLDVFCRNPREARRGPNLLDYALSKTRIKRALRRTLKRMIMDIVKWFEQPQQTLRIRR